ncbi:MAG: acyl-CoA dehydratase activase-related protein [Syntrophomonadaceae bacterium]|nr:acyl-CoA dehydratase activase-related protein [Syntrophomonadaceae bacterium]
MKRVGIPRGLFYYYYYPLWKSFFTNLGAQVVTSAPTNRLTVEQGIQSTVDESCYPIKVYFGHIKQLCRESIDYLFIPRIVSVEKRSYICPKFMGIPDMVRARIDNLPPLIDTIIDFSRDDKLTNKEIIKAGKIFTHKTSLIRDAYQAAGKELQFCKTLTGQGHTMAEAISLWEGTSLPRLNSSSDLTVGLLGHGYSLYDQDISMNIIDRLRLMGCRVVLPEALDKQDIESRAATLPKRVFWTLGRKMVGSALYMAQRQEVDGIIYVACFGCGPDSMVGEIIERKIAGKPFMLITVDEHTGEAGLITRLEAFCDMLKRRRMANDADNFSPHG